MNFPPSRSLSASASCQIASIRPPDSISSGLVPSDRQHLGLEVDPVRGNANISRSSLRAPATTTWGLASRSPNRPGTPQGDGPPCSSAAPPGTRSAAQRPPSLADPRPPLERPRRDRVQVQARQLDQRLRRRILTQITSFPEHCRHRHRRDLRDGQQMRRVRDLGHEGRLDRLDLRGLRLDVVQ